MWRNNGNNVKIIMPWRNNVNNGMAAKIMNNNNNGNQRVNDANVVIMAKIMLMYGVMAYE